MSLRNKIAAAAVAVATAASLAACASEETDVIKIGSTDLQQKQWQVFQEEVEKAGINAEFVQFSDYNLPNDALDSGEIDINNFQHMKFLAEYNVGKGKNLVPVGATEIVPLGLYYLNGSTVDDVAAAGEVVLPNDPSNQGRAINVLVQAGLVTLKSEGLLTPTPADIDEAASKVRVVPVDAAQTATSYLDGTPAIVNNSFLAQANIDPTSRVFADDPAAPEAQPYINAFVTTKDRQNDPVFKQLVEIWHTKPVQDALNEQSSNTSVAVQMDTEEITKVLTETEEKVRAAQQ